MHVRRGVRSLVVLGLLAAALPGCGTSLVPPDAVCVPELHVSPENPRPGRIVTVTADPACPTPEGTEWTLRIQPADSRIPLSQARVRPDADGTFSTEITVPPTMPAGPAIVWLTDYWDDRECPDQASCASAEGQFTVAP